MCSLNGNLVSVGPDIARWDVHLCILLFLRQFLQRRHRVPVSLEIPISRLSHEPFLLRIEVSVFRLSEEDINLRRILSNILQKPGCNDSHDALCGKRIWNW